MKKSKIVTVVIAVALQHVIVGDAFAANKGRSKATAYCFDAAFHEKTGRLFDAGANTGLRLKKNRYFPLTLQP